MKPERYHPNPQVRKAMNAPPAKREDTRHEGIKKEESDSHGEAHKIERTKKPEGGYHTVTHHADGNQEHADHATLAEAHQNEAQSFGEHAEPDADEHGGPSDGDADDCPDCGGAGCAACGYTGKASGK